MPPLELDRRKLLAVSATLAAMPGVTAELGAVSARLDALMRDAVRPDGPGGAIAVVQDGRTLFQGCYGLASVEFGMPIQPTTVFHIASVSKQFVAMAIAMLIEKTWVGLDDDVRRFIPELPYYGARIEVQHLIHHTSGIRDQWAIMEMAGWMEGDLFRQADVLQVICRQKAVNFEPDPNWMLST